MAEPEYAYPTGWDLLQEKAAREVYAGRQRKRLLQAEQLDMFWGVEHGPLFQDFRQGFAELNCQRCGQRTVTKPQGDTYGVCPRCGAVVERASRPRSLADVRS